MIPNTFPSPLRELAVLSHARRAEGHVDEPARQGDSPSLHAHAGLESDIRSQSCYHRATNPGLYGLPIGVRDAEINTVSPPESRQKATCLGFEK
jgi:hypothetical protein